MSELAFDEDGQPFQVSDAVVLWRVRRFANPGKPGAPQVVYSDNGLPLYLPVDATPEEFREAVGGVPARYRLDGVDERNRPVAGVPAAYLGLNGPTSASGAAAAVGGGGYGGGIGAPPPAMTAVEYALVAAVNANRDSLMSMTAGWSSVCDSLSGIMRAADGAGLPRRAPLGPLLVDPVDGADDDEDDDDGERNAAPPPAPPPSTFATLLGQVMQVVQMFAQMNNNKPPQLGAVMGQVAETAKVVEAIGSTVSASAPSPDVAAATEHEPPAERVERSDMRAAAAPANGTAANGAGPRAKRSASSAMPAAGKPPANTSGTSAPEASGAPAADPAVQFQQIMAALTPEEQMQVQYVVTRLSMGDLMQWYEQLASMPVAEGVAKIRAELARSPTEQAA